MKNYVKKFTDGVLIGAGILFVLGIANAAVNLSASSGEALTYTKWNNLVDKVSGIYTDGSGNVGIGTENPQNNFSVFKGTPSDIAGDTLDSYSIADFTANTNEDGIKRGLSIGAPTSNINSPVFLKVNSTSNRLAFLNQFNTENMTILDNGNVGIGMNTPTEKLEVNGDTKMRRLILTPSGGGSTCSPNGQIILDTNGHFYGCSGGLWYRLDN